MKNNRPEETIPSKIKALYLELPDYQFFHSPTSTPARNLYVGRKYVKDRLKALLLHSGSCASGAYLVTGYRGMGKTSVVEQVIREINGNPPKFIRMELALSQEDVRDEDVLRAIARMLHRQLNNLSKNEGWKDLVKTQEFAEVLSQLDILSENLYDLVRRSAGNVYSEARQYGAAEASSTDQESRAKELIRNLASTKEIEKELIYILDRIHQFRERNPKLNIPHFIFVIDELDKIEPYYFFDPEYSDGREPSRERTTNIFGANKSRKRQEVIARLLANLKSFLNTAKAKFIFIGGREMYDAALADIADRDSFYSSIFHDIIYVNSFFKDKNNSRSGLTDLTETYLCKLLIPDLYIKQVRGVMPTDDSPYNMTMLFNYLVHLLEMQQPPKQGRKTGHLADMTLRAMVYKTIFFLQNFIIFLTYRSNGTPKKLVSLIETYIRAYDEQELEAIRKNEIVLCQPAEKKGGSSGEQQPKRLFLQFTYNQQYEIGLTSNLYRPYVIIHSRYLKSLGDKLLYSTAFVIDFMLKFHPHAFSWRNLEMIPEIILVNKDPNLRFFLEDVLKFLSGMYIRETLNGIFQYKFFNKQANEIKLLTKTAEPASAAFNFTLDESLHIKRYYRMRLAELQKMHPNFNEEYIHSIGFVQNILGDLHYFDKEYDEAIIYYTDATQVLRQMVQRHPKKVTKHQAVIYVRNKLLLGLCLEKIKAWDSAYSVYRGLILNMPRLLDKVSHLDSGVAEHEQSDANLVDSWDKPIRRMQLFIKPNIALLDLIEKQRMDGITFANLLRNYNEIHHFLIPKGDRSGNSVEIGELRLNAKIKSDQVRVNTLFADYYNNVGSILFYKNRNFSELYTVLKRLGLSSKASDSYQKFVGKMGNDGQYFPSISSFVYYYLSLNHLLQSYEHKLRELNKINLENSEEFLEFSKDQPFAKAVGLLLPQCEGNINKTGLYLLGNVFSKIGDVLFSSLTKHKIEQDGLDREILDLFGLEENNEINQPDSRILIRLIRKLQEVKTIEQLCNINYILAIYRAAGFFYLRASRTYSYGFQYKKFLFILKDYVNSFSTETELDQLKDVIWPTIENVATKIFHANTWISEVANRPQILKYREVLKFSNTEILEEGTSNIYLNITSSPEIRETIVLVEEIKLKLNNRLNNFNTDHASIISPYDLVSNKYTRIHELRYQCDLNYIKLKDHHIEVLLKSTIVTDLRLLGLYKSNADLEKYREKIRAHFQLVMDAVTKKVPPPPLQLGQIFEGMEDNLSPANKVRNIEAVIQDRMRRYAAGNPGKPVLKNVMKEVFPELYVAELQQAVKNAKTIICDSIFCLFEVVRTLNLYGINYISNHSFLANIHFKFANWCQAFINYEILIESGENNKSTTPIRALLKKVLGDEDIYYIEPNYHNELALQHFYSSLQTHNSGRAYRSISQTMSFLEDDFNDNLSHFSAAAERFRMNTNMIREKITKLKQKVSHSNLYNYDNYRHPIG